MNHSISQLVNDQHISVATFKRSGESVETAVWFEVYNDKIYFRTVDNSGKVKRIRNNASVRVAACTSNGELTGRWYDGSAHLLAVDHPLSGIINERMDNKYGDQRLQMTQMVKSQGLSLVYVEISLSDVFSE